ncbi:hypothetical protein [Spirosoma sp.]|uniref:hypothetical protein n=1 Tax=Spirosoma sp. TaxID=1899569 RepID=UPI002630C220|nr:hypothetical protein [Spirosoma sp.]MCX6218987.1 hypothetical protein [Spirosoma sp.]
MISFVKKITLVACLLVAGNVLVIAQPTYSFIQKISLPTGEGKWDYLKMDGEWERLFVSHFDEAPVFRIDRVCLVWSAFTKRNKAD